MLHLESWKQSLVGFGLMGGVLAATLGIGCDGSATQTTTGKGISGTLVDIHGKPVAEAKVKAWPASNGPNGLGQNADSVHAATAMTDPQGRYSLANLEVGVYNIYGEKNDGTVLIPRVKYLEADQSLGTDTLKPSGSISGKVLSDGNGLGPVFCYLQGSSLVAITDSNGVFLLENVPEGEYRLNYFGESRKKAIDSPVVVLSGKTTQLADKKLSIDLALQPPAPKIISATYDSISGTMNIRWNAVHVEDFQEYWIEAFDETDTLQVNINYYSVIDTVFSDEIGLRSFLGYQFNGIPYIRNYRIRARDKEGNLSRTPEQVISILVTRPTILNTQYSVKLLNGNLNTPICGDTLAFTLDIRYSPAASPIFLWQMVSWMSSEDTVGRVVLDSLATTRGSSKVDTLLWTKERVTSVPQTTGLDSLSLEISFVSSEVSEIIVSARTFPILVDSLGCYTVKEPIDRLP